MFYKINPCTMLSELYFRSFTPKSEPIDPTYIKLCPVDKVVNGVLSKSSEFKVFDFRDDKKELTMYDFAIGNLVAVGAKLQPCQFRAVNLDSALVAADKIVALLDSPNTVEN